MLALLCLIGDRNLLSVRVEDAAMELLKMIGTGARVQPTLQLANAFAEHRYDPELLRSLGVIANNNAREDNFERALHRWTRRQWFTELIPDPYEFPLLVAGPTKLRVKRIVHAALLLHEWFGALYKFPELVRDLMTGGDENLRVFWDHSKGTDWYERHPVVGTAPPEKLVPIGLHGDDVGVYSVDRVRVITWGSVVTSLNVLDTRLVFTGIFDKHLLPDVTMEEIFRVLTWSLKALALGVYPDRDHRGTMFSMRYHPHRFEMRGQPIAGGSLWALGPRCAAIGSFERKRWGCSRASARRHTCAICADLTA